MEEGEEDLVFLLPPPFSILPSFLEVLYDNDGYDTV